MFSGLLPVCSPTTSAHICRISGICSRGVLWAYCRTHLSASVAAFRSMTSPRVTGCLEPHQDSRPISRPHMTMIVTKVRMISECQIAFFMAIFKENERLRRVPMVVGELPTPRPPLPCERRIGRSVDNSPTAGVPCTPYYEMRLAAEKKPFFSMLYFLKGDSGFGTNR